MIDSVALFWGHAIGSAARRATAHPERGRRAEPLSPPVRLDFERLVDRFGSDDGEVRAVRFKDKVVEGAHWKIGDIELLYKEGRVELRASLPKILTGDNKTVLDERGVHDGLRELCRRGAELAEHSLELAEAVPARLDYVYQWTVPSVAVVAEFLRSSFHPARLRRTEQVSPHGGRTIGWGYSGKRVIRFYDKGAEVAERLARESVHHNIPPAELDRMSNAERRRAIRAERAKARERFWREAELDTMLRYEIQDRRRQRIWRVHENGYRGDDVQHELEHTVSTLQAVACRDLGGLIEEWRQEDGQLWQHAVAYSAASLHFVEHEADLAIVREKVSRRAFYDWRKRTKHAALAVADWRPEIPPNAFAGSSLWTARSRSEQQAA